MENQHWLLDRLLFFHRLPAMIWRDTQITYNELLHCIQQWLVILKNENIHSGEIVALCGDCTPQTCALLIALFINKNIVLPLVSTTPMLQEQYIQLAEAHYAITLTEERPYIIQRYHCQTTHSLLLQMQHQDEPGLILFSSGSTGASKAIVLAVNRLLKKNIALRQGVATLFFLLLDHIGGINTLLHVLTQGGVLIIPDNREPEIICQVIERHRIALLPTTPTFLTRLVMSEVYKQYDLSSLQLITYGTEPMLPITLAHLNLLFPTIKFKQTYGLSELGILPTKSESPHSLWFLLGNDHVHYKIVDNILFIKSPSAMLGYLNAPNPFDADGWFVTGDMVETKRVAGKEYLRVLGRQSEIINVGGQKVYPAEVEDILLQVSNIGDVVVSGKKNPVIGHVVIAFINVLNQEDTHQLFSRIKTFCKDKIEPYKIPVLIKIVPHNLYGARFKKLRQVPQ